MSHASHYALIKQIFAEGDAFDYVHLNKSVYAYDKLLACVQKPLKLVLFFGKPGTGKTYLLRKIYHDLHVTHPLVFFPQPFFDESQFLVALYEKIFEHPAPEIKGYEHFLGFCEAHAVRFKENPTIVLLDEAQLYPPELIEKIRLMADTRMFRFLFTVHQTDKEALLAKDYFATRIWESIELPDSSLGEIALYLEKKLLFHHHFEYLHFFTSRQLKRLFALTRGNLRTFNKLMFKIFELYEYYDVHAPARIRGKHAKTKLIEMAAIESGFIHA